MEINSKQIKDGEVKRADLNTATSGSAVVRKLVAGTGITLDSTGVDAGTGDVTITATAVSDHGNLTGLSDDDHTQYALLAGRSGGQTLIGGTASGNNLNLKSTSDATKGKVVFGNAATTAYDEVNERLGIGTASPTKILDVTSTTSGVLLPRMTTTQRDAVSSPTAGEMIYNSTNARLEGYINSVWKPVAAIPYCYLQFASATFTTSDVVYAGVQTYNSDTGVFSWNDGSDILTLLQAGTYEISFNMDANNSGSAVGDAVLKLFYNGSYYAQSSACISASITGGTGGCQCIIEAAANDTLQWKRRKLNGSSATITAGTNLVVKKLK